MRCEDSTANPVNDFELEMSSGQLSLVVAKPHMRYLYTTSDDVFLLLPTSGGNIINTDNTCKTVVAAKTFFGKNQDASTQQDSALHELQRYKTYLQKSQSLLQLFANDNTTTESAQRNLAKQLTQVEEYIRSLEQLRVATEFDHHRQQQIGLLDCLNGSFPEYPSAMLEFLSKPERNLYPVLLKPSNPDSWVRTTSHVFSMQRTTQLLPDKHTSPSALYGELQRLSLNNIQLYQSQSGGISDTTTLSAQILTKLLPQLGTTYPIPTETVLNKIHQVFFSPELNSVFDSSSVNLSTLRNNASYLTYDESTPINTESDLRDLVNSLVEQSSPNLDQLSAANAETRTLFNQLYSMLVIHRTEKANILVQFFLAEINVYAAANRLSSFDFGQILENNTTLSRTLALAIQQALQTGTTSVEAAILDFINRNMTMFGLCQPLNDAAKKTIRESFVLRYESVQDAPHFDDFMLLDHQKKREALFFTYKGHICCNFATLVTTTSWRQYRASSYSALTESAKALPANLSDEDNQTTAGLPADINRLKQNISNAVRSNNYDQLSTQLLLRDTQGVSVFQRLGADFFVSVIDQNTNAKALLSRVHSTLREASISQAFNRIVLGQGTQILLTPDARRALYVAVQDRTEISVGRVLKYDTAQDIHLLLQDLMYQAHRNETCHDLLGIDPNFSIKDNGDGNFIIEAPKKTIDTLNTLIRTYKNSIHISMTMAGGLYKQVRERFGASSAQYQELMEKNNNTGDGIPHRLLYALNLLEIPITDVRYNNTKNALDMPTSGENLPNHLRRKGGSGFVVDGLDAESIRTINNIGQDQQNRFVLLQQYCESLALQINDEKPKTPSLRLLPEPSNKRSIEWARWALNSLGIRFETIERDRNRDNQELVVVLPPQEQAKIKWMANHHNKNPQGIPFNNEDKQYTREYKGTLCSQDSITSNQLRSDLETLTLTPEMARSIYVAVQDRQTILPGHSLKYTQVEDVQWLLSELYRSAREGNPYSGEYADFNDLRVDRASLNTPIKVTGSRRAIGRLKKTLDTYQNQIHLSTDQNAAIYRQFEAVYGKESELWKRMMKLDNNQSRIPIPQKFLFASFALGLISPSVFSVRYNNTLNTLPYKTEANAHQDPKTRKGGTGCILEGISNTALQFIEEITERNFYVMKLTSLHEMALVDLLGELMPRFNNNYPENDRKARLEAALVVLGLDYTAVKIDEGSAENELVITGITPLDQAKIKKILFNWARTMNVSESQVSQDIDIANTDMQQRVTNYDPRQHNCFRQFSSATLIDQSRNSIKANPNRPRATAIIYRHTAKMEGDLTEALRAQLPNSIYLEQILTSLEAHSQAVKIPPTIDQLSERGQSISSHQPTSSRIFSTASNFSSTAVPTSTRVMQQSRNHGTQQPSTFSNLPTTSAATQYSGWSGSAGGGQRPLNFQLADSVQRVMDGLVSKKDRCFSFTLLIDKKFSKLHQVNNWLRSSSAIQLGSARGTNDTRLTIINVLFLIRSICAIKRNPLGIFQPTSVIQIESTLIDCLKTVDNQLAHWDNRKMHQFVQFISTYYPFPKRTIANLTYRDIQRCVDPASAPIHNWDQVRQNFEQYCRASPR